ncbi:MAG: tetratricopeptide repeat protein [Bacteroidota bacterium]
MQTLRITLIFAICLFVQNGYADRIDSLRQVLDNKNLSDEQIIQLKYQLGNDLHLDERYDEAEQCFIYALEIAQRKQDNISICKVLLGLGRTHESRTNYPEALAYYKEVLEMQVEGSDITRKAAAFSQMSSIYQALGDYEKAFEMQLSALQIHEKVKDSEGIARAHYVIGTIFFYQKQFEQSLEYYEKAKILCDKINKERLIYSCLAALGSVHSELSHYKESLYYNDKALQLARKLEYKIGIAYVLGNIGSNYLKQGNLEQAEIHKKQAIQLMTSMEDKWGAIGNKLGLAKVYLEAEKTDMVIPTLEDALQMSKELDSKPRQLEAYQIFIETYEQLEDVDKAYFYLKKHQALKDSLINEKTLEEMGQSQRRYEIQRREHEISLLKKENELLAKNKKIQKQQIYIFGIAFLSFLVVLGWFITRLKYQRNINHLLEEKNLILNSKNDEIRIKNKQLEHSNQDLQQFAYVASHDLKEPLRMIHSYTSLLKKRYDTVFDSSGKEFMHYVTDAVIRMQTLLDDLLDYSRTGSQKVPLKKIKVHDVLTIVQANLRHRLEEYNGRLIVCEENMPMVRANHTQLIQLFQNLISNALKFRGKETPVVQIDCIAKDDNYVFSIKDNGIGISKHNLTKVFEMFRRLHSRSEYEGTGIGLATCKRIVSNMGGDIWVESTPGEGSTFYFSIPNTVNEMAQVSTH